MEIGRHQREFHAKLVDGSVRGIVVVPSYFSSFRKRSDHIAPIQVIADGSEPNTANFVDNYVQMAFQNWLFQETISSRWVPWQPIQVEPRFWFNEDLESRNFLIPGSIALIMTLIGTLLTSLVVAREWERGTMEALMATPVTITELVLGKLISYFLLGDLVSFFHDHCPFFLPHSFARILALTYFMQHGIPMDCSRNGSSYLYFFKKPVRSVASCDYLGVFTCLYSFRIYF